MPRAALLSLLALPPLVLSLRTGLPASQPADDRIDFGALEPPARFDFLLGSWDYENGPAFGQATYRRTADGRALREDLEGTFQGRTFSGASFTWWDEQERAFQRRWIDTFGNVIEGTARMEEYERSDLPAMVSTARFGETWMRHVWYDVTKSGFETDLWMSNDGGETYRRVRELPYRRPD